MRLFQAKGLQIRVGKKYISSFDQNRVCALEWRVMGLDMGLLVRAMLVAVTNKSINLTGSNQQNLSLASIKSLIGITNQQTPQFQGVILGPGSFHPRLSHQLRSPEVRRVHVAALQLHVGDIYGPHGRHHFHLYPAGHN